MSAMTVYIHNTVKDADGYRALAEKMSAFVKDNEPGTIVYDWHLSDDGAKAFNIDGYDSTDSFLQHFGNAQEQGFLEEFMRVVEIDRVIVTGNPTAAADPVIEQLGAEIVTEIGSLHR